MTDKVLNFPAPRSKFDAINEAHLTDEERTAIRAALDHQYSEQRAREAAARETARTMSPEAFAARIEYEQRRQEPTQNADGVRVGDIFCVSWGYEQTNVNFYQVVALKGKKTAVVREIAGECVGGFSYQGKKRPCRAEFIGPAYTVRSKPGYQGAPRLNDPEHGGHSLSLTSDDAEHDYSSYA